MKGIHRSEQWLAAELGRKAAQAAGTQAGQGANRRGVDAGPAGRVRTPQTRQIQASTVSGKPTKYHAVPVMVGSERFDSKLEARIWQDLKLAERTGNITDLRRQVRFSLFGPNGEHVGVYRADFCWYAWARGVTNGGKSRKFMVADAKSPHTRKLPGWSRTKALMRACHGIDVAELP